MVKIYLTKKSIFILICCVCIVFFATSIAAYYYSSFFEGVKLEEDNIPQLRSLAQNAYKKGEYQRTIEIYKAILNIDPKDPDVYIQIAGTYRYWNKYEESEKWFLKAIALDPKAKYYTDLGKLYRNMHEDAKAEIAFKKSIEIDPMLDTTYSYGLGYLYLQEKRYEESEAMFKKAFEINPYSEMTYMGLGDLYRETGRYEESEAMFKKAFEINPYSESYLGLGWLYIYQHRYEDAEIPLRAFLENIREKAEVYYALGRAYLGNDKYKKANDAFVRAVELNPDNELFVSTLEELGKQYPAL